MEDKLQHSKPVPPFVRFCTANIPMVFDDSLSYYEALSALWKFIQKDVIDVINNNANVTQKWREELTEFEGSVTDEIEEFKSDMRSDFSDLNDAFDTLKTWVETYFDNLDVQEEINNKLDEMAEDGTLEQIVEHYVNFPPKIKFHAIAKSAATFIVELPNGKNLIVDSGTAEQWTDIKDAIDSLGITKFDYAITTHFHPDHYGNNANLLETYDFTGCQWYIGMKPDYENHSTEIYDLESDYDNQVYVLTSHGINPIIPTNGSSITLDSDYEITMQFFNTDPITAEHYYGRYTEYYDDAKVSFNDFCLIANLKYKNQSILFTGDIERPVEDYYANRMTKATIMTAPHHGVNMDANVSFYSAVSPDVTICNYITNINTWVQSYYKSIKYIIENSKKVITYYNNESDNDIFTIELDGYNHKSNVRDGGITNNSPNFELDAYDHIESLIERTTDNRATLSLKDYVLRLPIGGIADIPFTDGYDTTYAQIWTDLNDIFDIPNKYPRVHIERSTSYINFKIYVSGLVEEASFVVSDWASFNKDNLRITVKGYGNAGFAYNDTELVSIINKLPNGTYRIGYQNTVESSIFRTDAVYESTIQVNIDSTTRKTGTIYSTIRTTVDLPNKYCACGYFDTSQETKVKWRAIA